MTTAELLARPSPRTLIIPRVGDNPEDWSVGADRDLSIDSSTTWDGDAAKETIFNWAEDSDGNIDAAKAKRGFLIYDAGNSELRGAYKLPFARYVGGSLKASPAGLRAAASRLPQTDAPQETLDRARAVLDHYFEKLEEEAAKSWARRRAEPPAFVMKEAFLEVGDDRNGHFIASSSREDRYGDVIEQSWDLEDFWRNPVFLWGHQSWEPPIGWVREFNSNNDQTMTYARVEFLPEKVDPFVDKLYQLTRIGALRAVSVGFIPIETEPRFNDDKEWIGFRFMRSKLVELSLCSVPANPDAVSLARSIDPHPAFLRRVFSGFVPRSARSRSAPALEMQGFTRRNKALSDLERFKRVA